MPLVICLLCTFVHGFGGSGLIPFFVWQANLLVWVVSGGIGQAATEQRMVTGRNMLLMFVFFGLGVVSGWVVLALKA